MAKRVYGAVGQQRLCVKKCSIFIIICLFQSCTAQLANDTQALQAFKASVDSTGLLNWTTGNPCDSSWRGIVCERGRVFKIILPNAHLRGSIESLGSLDSLRLLNLRGNSLIGSLPDFSRWRNVRGLYLQQNEISGQIPTSIASLIRVSRLDLSSNNLTGQIPSLLSLSHLLTLRLSNNSLSGQLPSVNVSNLQNFNVSYNHLVGKIPSGFAKFDSSAFANNSLCGDPLPECVSSPSPSPSPRIVPSSPSSRPNESGKKGSGSKLTTGAIIAIVVGDAAVLVIIILMFLFFYWRKYLRHGRGKSAKRLEDKNEFSSSQYSVQVPEAERSKLVFFNRGKNIFELEDLLRASAEMLGKGSFGTAYKAVLEDGTVVAVKRLKDVSISGRKEFEQHMELVGKLKHANIVQLRAYYYAKEEKLLVYDYMPNGSLYSLLHGHRGPGRTPLDWTTRLKIAVDAARGLAYIHRECTAHKVPHGNIKSSNVLINKTGNACISDFGLALLMNATSASRLVGYRAPEHNESRKISQRADVYSFGVLLLEILTGKAPAQSHMQGEAIDLPKWVQSVVREEWTAEVFDVELMRYKNIEEEMVVMLQIAMVCVSQAPEARPKMSEVVKMLEDIKGEPSPIRDDLGGSQNPSPTSDGS